MYDVVVCFLYCYGVFFDLLKVLEVCVLQYYVKCLFKMYDLVIVFSGYDCFVYGIEVGNFK